MLLLKETFSYTNNLRQKKYRDVMYNMMIAYMKAVENKC